jgi:hypothetical protein
MNQGMTQKSRMKVHGYMKAIDENGISYSKLSAINMDVLNSMILCLYENRHELNIKYYGITERAYNKLSGSCLNNIPLSLTLKGKSKIIGQFTELKVSSHTLTLVTESNESRK